MGPEDAVYQLQSLNLSWEDFFEQAWQGVTDEQWQQFAGTVPADRKEKLHELLPKVISTVAAVARGCAAAQATLKTLRKGVDGGAK